MNPRHMREVLPHLHVGKIGRRWHVIRYLDGTPLCGAGGDFEQEGALEDCHPVCSACASKQGPRYADDPENGWPL